MLATAIGDALGWPNEPRSKNRAKRPAAVDCFVEWTRSSNSPRWHDEKILPGEYSDDTQLTLSVARSIIAGDWEKFFSEKELPYWLKYERGGGSAMLKAARCYQEGLLPWRSSYARNYFNAGGNGVVMRILPHVIASAKTPDPAGLIKDVIKDALITHGHPRAILGAACYAYALDYLLRKDTTLEYGELVAAVIDGQNVWGRGLEPEPFGRWLDAAQKYSDHNFSTEWENIRAHMAEQLEFIGASLKKGLILDDTKVLTHLDCFGKFNGAGDVSALSAIYLASKYANNPPLGIKVPAFAFGADTDTVASITGGLLGMLNGTNWIPAEWKKVQDYDCLIQMADLLLADGKGEAAGTQASDNQWRTTPIGRMKPLDSRGVPNGKHGTVTITKWKTMLGQTLYTKSFQSIETQVPPRQVSSKEQLYEQSSLYNMPPQTERNAPPSTTSQITAPDQRSTAGRKQQFVLTSAEISRLLSDPQCRTNITVGKVLKVIRSLMDGQKSSAAIAKQLRIDQAIVEQISSYISESK